MKTKTVLNPPAMASGFGRKINQIQQVWKPNEIMKIIKSLIMAAVVLTFSAVAGRAQISLDFSSTVGSTIQFNGTNSTFQFNTSTSSLFGGIFFGTQWSIGNETGGDGSALGLFGSVSNSPFSYGPITTNILGSTTNEVALVLGPLGALMIKDGVGNSLTGSVSWIQLSTHDFAGGINAGLTVNVTGLTYGGTNADLLNLVANGPGFLDLTFQFSPGKTLGDLTSGSGPYLTSYSGSIAAVPEPTSIGLFLTGLAAFACSQRLIRNRRS